MYRMSGPHLNFTSFKIDFRQRKQFKDLSSSFNSWIDIDKEKLKSKKFWVIRKFDAFFLNLFIGK